MESGEGDGCGLRSNPASKTTNEFDLLSQETIGGKQSYWLGFAVTSPDIQGKIVGKMLVIPESYQARKLIVQLPGMAAMEMPIAVEARNTAVKDIAKFVGTETISVPAGSFECEHWHGSDGSDAWLSAKIGPVKVVKSVDKNETWVLVRTIGVAKDAVTGPVKPYNPEAIQTFADKQTKGK